MNRVQPYAIDINNISPQTRNSSFYPPMQPALLLPTVFYWLVAVQTFGGNAYLLLLRFNDGWDAGSQMMEHALEELHKIPSRRFHGWRMSMLCTKTTVGTARVKHIMKDNVDSNLSFRVNLDEYEHDAHLTEIYFTQGLTFNHPAHLAETCCRFLNSTSIDDCRGQRVIVLRKVLDKQKIACILILLLLVSPALGLTVGNISHRADVGISVSVGIFALATILQGLAAWFEQ